MNGGTIGAFLGRAGGPCKASSFVAVFADLPTKYLSFWVLDWPDVPGLSNQATSINTDPSKSMANLRVQLLPLLNTFEATSFN